MLKLNEYLGQSLPPSSYTCIILSQLGSNLGYTGDFLGVFFWLDASAACLNEMQWVYLFQQSKQDVALNLWVKSALL